MCRRLAQLVGCVLILFSSLSARAESLPDVVDRIRGGIVSVGTWIPTRSPPGAFLGTGFAVGDGTLVVTNYHVLPTTLDRDRKERIAVFSGRGKRGDVHTAQVLANDPVHDVSLLRIDGEALPALTLAPADEVPREGSTIALTGFPIGMVLGLYPTTHTGIVSAISPVVIPQNNSKQLTARMIQAMRNPYEVLQLDAVAYPGNSGSPVYDPESGAVLGVLNSVFVKDLKESALERPTGISYAIPVRWVHELMKEAGINPNDR